MSKPLNVTGVGPAVYAYRSLSEVARANDKTNTVFYSHEEDPAKVECPFSEPGVLGNCIQLVQICHYIPYPSGRKQGTLIEGNVHLHFDVACVEHLEAAARPPLPASYSKDPACCTCYYCLSKDNIDPEYVAPLTETKINPLLITPESRNAVRAVNPAVGKLRPLAPKPKINAGVPASAPVPTTAPTSEAK